MLPVQTLKEIEDWIDKSHIDLLMVIGTSARVYPAAGYIEIARGRGARVAVINMDYNDEPAGGMYEDDWFFQGDASEIVPELLKSVIGEIEVPERPL
jgi:NAD-dependent SIR2 family protein deacetylase